MHNPFEKEDARYNVLINHEEQYSLWPESIDVPKGWSVVYGPDTKESCGEYIEENWQDMRPRSLRDKMDGVYAR